MDSMMGMHHHHSLEGGRVGRPWQVVLESEDVLPVHVLDLSHRDALGLLVHKLGERLHTTGLACFAEGQRPSAKAQKPSAKKNPRQRKNKKKLEKNSKIILFFLEALTSHHYHPRDFL
jgi:hypothetical protein